MAIINKLDTYIDQQLLLINLEKKAQNLRYGEKLNAHNIKLDKQNGLVIHPLKVTHRYFGLGDYPMLDFQLHFKVNFSLFKASSSVDFFNAEGEIMPAKLIDINEKGGTIKLLGEDFPDWAEEKSLGIKIAPDNRTFDLMKQIIQKLKSKENTTLERYCAILTEQRETYIEQIQFKKTQLNESQNKAIASIIGLDGILLLHGPPGTGKTSTIAQAVVELKNQSKKTIASAPSNAAVDHLTRQFASKGLNVVRLGNNDKIQDDILAFTPDELIKNSTEAKQLKKLKTQVNEYRKMASQYKRKFGKEEREQRNLLYKEVRSIRKEITDLNAFLLSKIIEKADVICGTPIALVDNLPENFTVDYAFIDEASQCMQALAWCVMQFSLNTILVGDPFQLPPTYLLEEKKQNIAFQSMLELCFNQSLPTILLDTQYRMDEQICAFSNTYFYDNKLKSATIKSENALIFYDTAGSGADESNETGRISNPMEMNFIQLFLQTETAKNIHWSVISPYQGQIGILKENEAFKTIKISTIDSFQGQEDEGIIISLVRSNAEQNIGFLRDYRRMNVALTRAKKKLVVFGDSATIGNDPFFQEWLNFIEQQQAYRSVFELDYAE